MTTPLTVGKLRAVLADAPDDAVVRVNAWPIDEDEAVLYRATDAEYLTPEQWRGEAGVLIQAERTT